MPKQKSLKSDKNSNKNIQDHEIDEELPEEHHGDELFPEKIISDDHQEEPKYSRQSDGINDLLFKLPVVKNPLIGTPKQVQKDLDKMALKIQKYPSSKKNDDIFNRIHLYMHGYLLNVVLRQFPYMRGMQTSDIYQEALLAIRFKAIPGFDATKGMSFLNFSKMCIKRHLITKLNESRHRQKDKMVNEAISLDSTPLDDDSGNTLSNIIADETPSVDKRTERHEAIHVTKQTLMNELSDFEKKVLMEYLTSSSYKEITSSISKNRRQKLTVKTVDNALLRIRKKAALLRKRSKDDDLPLFIL